jgi:SsrA-binding protein
MGIKIIAKNKKASYDYFLEQKYEAGIVLQGTEIKSLRQGKVSLQESFIQIDKNGEVWLQNMTIPHYEFGNRFNHDETRKRKLLLNRKEIEKIELEVKKQNYTIIPTSIYFKKSLVKIEMALGKGKKSYDKRHDQAKKDVERKLQRGNYE